jgi:hypothetical protein
MFPGTSRVIVVTFDRTAGATLSGIRIDSQDTTVLFEGETWPPAAAAQPAFAQRLVDKLSRVP